MNFAQSDCGCFHEVFDDSLAYRVGGVDEVEESSVLGKGRGDELVQVCEHCLIVCRFIRQVKRIDRSPVKEVGRVRCDSPAELVDTLRQSVCGVEMTSGVSFEVGLERLAS